MMRGQIELRMRTITPLLIGDWCGRAKCRGDEESRIRETEIKAASREIFRNVAYQFLGSWRRVRIIESKLFGSTSGAAPVKIRAKPDRRCVPEEKTYKLCKFGDKWVKGAMSFQEKIKQLTGGDSRMFFHLRDHSTYLEYVSDVIEFRVELIPRWTILTRLSSELGLHWREIMKFHMSSIRYSLEILGIGKRRSRGMGRSLPVGMNTGLTEFPKDYEEMVSRIVGAANPRIQEGGAIGLRVLNSVYGEDKALLSVYLHAKKSTRCGRCNKNPHFMITAGKDMGEYVVACLVNFYLFRRRRG